MLRGKCQLLSVQGSFPKLRFSFCIHRIGREVRQGATGARVPPSPLSGICFPNEQNVAGEMAEWLKAHAWKVPVLLVTKNHNLV